MNIRKKYIPLESAVCFQFGSLFQKIKSEILSKHPECKTNKEEFERLMLKSLNAFKLNDQTFDYCIKNNHLGGIRWFVMCPQCKKKAIKLFFPPKGSNREQKYLCKDCHMLKNTSALLGCTDKYKKVVRPLKQLEKIRRLLLKKSMTPIKSKPLLEAYERIEEDLKNSQEYKLWKFQQEHEKILSTPEQT